MWQCFHNQKSSTALVIKSSLRPLVGWDPTQLSCFAYREDQFVALVKLKYLCSWMLKMYIVCFKARSGPVKYTGSLPHVIHFWE